MSCVESNTLQHFRLFFFFFATISAGGSSSLPCSDTYMGTSAASEIEVSTLQDHVRAIKDNVQIFMDVHAYSQYWMYPWAYTDSTNCTDINELVRQSI